MGGSELRLTQVTPFPPNYDISHLPEISDETILETQAPLTTLVRVEEVEVFLKLETLNGSYILNDEMRKRREILVGIAIQTLNKSSSLLEEGDWTPWSRSMHRDIFPDEVQILNSLLFRPIRVTDIQGEAKYTIRMPEYYALTSRLNEAREEILTELYEAGVQIPKVPTWGVYSGNSEWYSVEGYEILGAMFRTEVEIFLRLIIAYRPDEGRNEAKSKKRLKPRTEITPRFSSDRTTKMDLNQGQYQTPTRYRFTPGPRDFKPSEAFAKAQYPLAAIPQSQYYTARDSFRHRNEASTTVMRTLLGPTFQVHKQESPTRPSKQKPVQKSNILPLKQEEEEEEDMYTDREPQDNPHSPVIQGVNLRRRVPGGNDPDDPDDDPDDPYPWGGPNRPPRQRVPYNPLRNPQRHALAIRRAAPQAPEPRFDEKLKIDMIPIWNGNTDEIIQWMKQVSNIAQISPTIEQQLGHLVPRRFTEAAALWFWALPAQYRQDITESWDTLKTAIADYYMNRKWMQAQKHKALHARYREVGHQKETPSEYFIRKKALLEVTHTLDTSELIAYVMEGAPDSWENIISTHLYETEVDFQRAIRHYEHALIKIDQPQTYSSRNYGYGEHQGRGYKQTGPSQASRHYREGYGQARNEPESRTRTKLVGSYLGMPAPKFPKDDKNVTRKGQTPEAKGARPCRHCGSGKHWDNECKHSFKAMKQARANLGTSAIPEEDQEAQEEYDALYFELSEPEGESSDSDVQSAKVSSYKALVEPATAIPESSLSALNGMNRASRRRFAREVAAYRLKTAPTPIPDANGIIRLQKEMARPPGCSFLGAKATATRVQIGGPSGPMEKLIVDSGSDITLISSDLLDKISPRPRVKVGQKISLLQITATSSISGFVTIDIIFNSLPHKVTISVEAYVVNGMTTPIILGNDFADQYCLSLVRTSDHPTRLIFGNTGCALNVENVVGPVLTDHEGNCLRIISSQTNETSGSPSKYGRHKRLKRRNHQRTRNREVRATERVVIQPRTSKKVHIQAYFPKNSKQLYLERSLKIQNKDEQIYGTTDSLINVDCKVIHIANFSDEPVTIVEGEVIGRTHDPKNWLDRASKSKTKLSEKENKAKLLRALIEVENEAQTRKIEAQSKIESKAERNAFGENDPLAEDAVEGGPKIAETPPDSTPSTQLLQEVDISKELNNAFGLDGRLGSYEEKVHIKMKEGATPVSLPPFPASPANRKVIDEQIDAWLQLGVIEPSQSPWAAPAFIVWRNDKPRMVIDYRKLNDQVIPDEFPLPRQEDITQALNGSQYLSTLDALAGFTQLTMDEESAEKLAFRTHRGLHQFKRMPFGYRNGPGVFQRVMQNVLSPYLWVFTLVYIDDIIIFSLSFVDHCGHIVNVLQAIIKANITLSPKKCHFGYQSVALLGQKVSRLGMSTQKEKVKAITHLATPKNVKDLQTFLGMMNYFSSYIPFYSWLAHPLFALLKKDKEWEWEEVHEEAFELCKQALVQAPVRAYAMPNLPYRLYTDACDFGLAGILQQVQPIRVGDLKGTRLYEKVQKAFSAKQTLPPDLVPVLSKELNDVPKSDSWGETFDETIVYVERVVAYWSRVLKSPERNYSPTEREALALKESLIKFQGHIEGAKILAITDHAALTWSRTFQNVNRRLLTWGTVFAAYPGLRIIHRAGRVHSNVDPISRLRRRTPYEMGPNSDSVTAVELASDENDPMKNFYEEMGSHFEERLLKVGSLFCNSKDEKSGQYILLENGDQIAQHYNLLIQISSEEIQEWRNGYLQDEHFAQVLEAKKSSETASQGDTFPQYLYGDNGLLFFEDSQGNTRLCVPKAKRVEIMSDVHNKETEGAHAGYHRSYNRIASTYYWPGMSREIKKYTETCDICQKAKPRRHGPVGLLQPIPIPQQPFDVVTMDFIPDLPESEGMNNILVIVDKLTKYAIFIPCCTAITAKETADLFFHHIVTQYGLPLQVITDRGPQWKNDFWKEVCNLFGIQRSLTTSHHPQSDGQTEILNQFLEITLRAYISPNRDDWAKHLDPISLAYNTTPHTATKESPAYLLRGYVPRTATTLIHRPEGIVRPEGIDNDVAAEMAEAFEYNRNKAKDCLRLAQTAQERSYNKGRKLFEFQEGDKVVLNPHSLELLRGEKGKGRKLLMKYDGPFDILRKISPTTYQLRLPTSYGIHPIINIAHLEPYRDSPTEFGDRPVKAMNRADFNELPEVEVERIISQRIRKIKGRRITQYRVRFKDMGPEEDEWFTHQGLRNAPEILQDWKTQQLRPEANIAEGQVFARGRLARTLAHA